MEEIAPDWLNDYPEDKFTVFKTCFLSTQKNSHNLDISAEVLKRDAKTILGNFLVAKLQYGDASTHLPSEIIYGYFPKEQDVEFEETEDEVVDGDIEKADTGRTVVVRILCVVKPCVRHLDICEMLNIESVAF